MKPGTWRLMPSSSTKTRKRSAKNNTFLTPFLPIPTPFLHFSLQNAGRWNGSVPVNCGRFQA